MNYTQGKYPILSKKTLAKEIYDLTILCPDIAEAAKPGQFVNVKADGFMLRRPISICSINKEKGTLRIIFEVRGEGTKEMSKLNQGDMIDIVAPLGGGSFRLDEYNTAVIIGGGIGAPPMLAVAEKFGANGTVITGFRNAAAVILQEDFKATGAETILCTDDGSAGKKGFVTDALAEVLQSKKPDVIYACGPKIMLKKIAETAKSNGIPCQVSLEERMGCGVGACLVCACRTIRDGEEYYAHVCKDGPVFDSQEVSFDEQ
ncbi:MAG: dihydroorotate dehydrogenase electron transfer subunit [Oscillospiraceae bacterium]|nr:dihydroorotate dehydrogenase electron transfer subunit [Oscillospiraceae bacterium]